MTSQTAAAAGAATPSAKAEKYSSSSSAAKGERYGSVTPSAKGDRYAGVGGGNNRGGGGLGHEEKILVTVRMRPLSNKELAMRDHTAWDCIDSSTIVYTPMDKSCSPSSYTFDRVFGPTCSTQQVYEEGAKGVALSSLKGINATIFAYGQTSSGKTYTMKGIIEHAVKDIYSFIEERYDTKFVIKFSALEIYNELVRDLLNLESGELRLHDHPEKGPVVDKLLEVTVTSNGHIKELISKCDANRQVGETALNERSSRSHQIIRLSIESISEAAGTVKSLLATLNFVDLAGSERASQSHAEGVRLKEGCHINRSLLTLSTVIRKLSGGKKSGHIPYRDSKLTRILQPSLGGNARTAIICTLSPALTHVEQTKNTLNFATNAKEVTNTAHVNMVTSEKEKIKQLQKEMAVLQDTVANCAADKDEEIEKLTQEISELRMKYAEAIAKVAEYERMEDEQRKSKTPSVKNEEQRGDQQQQQEQTEDQPNVVGGRRIAKQPSSVRQSSACAATLRQEIKKLEMLQEAIGQDAGRAMQVLEKELECLRLAQSGCGRDAADKIEQLHAEIRQLRQDQQQQQHQQQQQQQQQRQDEPSGASSNSNNLMEEFQRLQANAEGDKTTIATLETQLETVQKSIANFATPATPTPTNTTTAQTAATPSPSLSPSPSRKAMRSGGIRHHNLMMRSPCSPAAASRRLPFENENCPPRNSNIDAGNNSNGNQHRRNSSVDVRKMQNMFKTAAEENIQSIRGYITDLKERVAKLQYQKQLLVCQVLELEAEERGSGAEEGAPVVQPSPSSSSSFLSQAQTKALALEEQRAAIIHLWHVCYVSIVHRSRFFLMFKGEPSDEIYFEVELRRLSWLHQHFASTSGPNNPELSPAQSPWSSPGPAPAAEEQLPSVQSSIRELKREREALSRRMRTKLTEEEREELFRKWDVALDSKQRKMQLMNKLWTNPYDMTHVEESAAVVAKLVAMSDVSKEMFQLNFAAPSSDLQHKPWLLLHGWNPFAKLLEL